jgi:hypothetical protein
MGGWTRSVRRSNAGIIGADVDVLIAGDDLDSQAVDYGSAMGIVSGSIVLCLIYLYLQLEMPQIILRTTENMKSKQRKVHSYCL